MQLDLSKDLLGSDKSMKSNNSTENIQAAEHVSQRNSATNIRNKYLMKLTHHRVWLAPVE